MQAEPKGPTLNLHPIRLQFIHLSQVQFKAVVIPESIDSERTVEELSPAWSVNIASTVDDPKAVVTATLTGSFPSPASGAAPSSESAVPSADAPKPFAPYSLEIAVTAGFTFDTKDVSLDNVKMWCEKGSFFIMLPFLRNEVAQITREAGFPEVLLPMLEVPTFRPPIKQPTEDTKSAEDKPE